MKNQTKYILSVLASGCLWGTMGYFRRTLGSFGADSFGIVFIRCSLAAVMFAIAIMATEPLAFRIRIKDTWCFIGSGIFSLLFFSSCYFQAMTLMSLSVAAILLYTAPCFVMLMSAVLFHEKLTLRKILAMVLAFAGCCLVSGIVGDDVHLTIVGLLYGLGSGIGYALYSIFGKLALARGYTSNTINFYSCLLAALGAGILWGFSSPLQILTASGSNFLFCVISALVTTFLPYLFYTYGLSGIEAGAASVIASVEPVVATIVGLIIFEERISASSVCGSVLVLAAIVLLNRRSQS